MKHCYIRLDEGFPTLCNNRFMEVILCATDEGIPMCYLAGLDDFELSYTGIDAEEKFEALLDVSGDVSFKYLLQLGFTQYG